MAPLRQLLEQYTLYDLSSRPLMQLKIKALVLDLVHSMDVVDQLQKYVVAPNHLSTTRFLGDQ